MVFPQGKIAVLVFGLALNVHAADLQQRIDKAAPGATIEVGPGVYPGGLIIKKPLTLVGRDMPRIDGGGLGHVIEIRANAVTVRGFEIAESGTNLRRDHAGIHITGDRATIAGNRIVDCLHGIYLKKIVGAEVRGNEICGKTTLPKDEAPEGLAVTIAADGTEMCALNINTRGNGIHLWNSRDCVIESNTVTESRDGMYFSFTNETIVRANHITKVRYGLHYMYSDQNRFEGNSFSDNVSGAAIMYSKGLVVRGNRFSANHGSRAYGMLLNSVDNTLFEGNVMDSNTVGIFLQNNNSNTFVGNRISNNYIGVRMNSSSYDNLFTENHFGGNLHPVELGGQSESNRWSLDGVGNRWDRASPVDLDGDGVGELPHREVDLLGDLRRPIPAAGLLSGSPGLELLEFAHRHVELPGVPGIKDPAPLTPRPPTP